jgi:hypothetical protein
MKSVFSVLVLSLLVLSCGRQQMSITTIQHNFPDEVRQEENVLSQPVRIINNTSLKSLQSVARDVSVVTNESGFREKFPLGSEGITVYLNDDPSNSFNVSASVMSTFSSTTFYVRINKHNQVAEDNALAVTLIHEIMHCILINIYRRAQKNDQQAFNSIESFGLNKNDPSNSFNDNFFDIMNEGEAGSHELMYRLFYPRMVLLLLRFAEIHKQPLNTKKAEFLMWSGLQNTCAFQKLSYQKRYDIEFTILKAKGFEVEEN